MKESEITDEEILEEMNQILMNPQLRKCSQCANADDACTRCAKTGKAIATWMYAGMCPHYETNEERIIRKSRERLMRLEKEQAKDNHLLTMTLNCLDAAMLIMEDFADRVEREYKIADMKGTGDPKVRKSDRLWMSSLKRAMKTMHQNMEGARRQYQHYVMPIYNKVFYDQEKKEYDVELYDDHQSDAMEIAQLILRYFNVAFLNKEVSDKVFNMLKEMKPIGVLEETDINHYNFRR